MSFEWLVSFCETNQTLPLLANLCSFLQLYTNWPTPVPWKKLFGIEWHDRNFCVGYSIFNYVLISYASVGSLGIAVYRTVHIKVSNPKVFLLNALLAEI